MSFSEVSQVIQSAPFGFLSCISDRNTQDQVVDFVFQEANDAFFILFGIDKEEIKNQKYSHFENLDRLHFLGDLKTLVEHVNTKSTGEYEFFFNAKNRWVRVHYHYSELAEKNNFHFIFYDITSSKQFKIETENFFNFSLDLLLIFNLDGLILKANNSWSESCLFSPNGREKSFALGSPR